MIEENADARCQRCERQRVRRMRPALGTFVEIVIDDPHVTDVVANQAANSAFEQIQLIHDALSFQQSGSLLNQLNCHPGEWICMPLAIRRLLSLAQLMTFKTHGGFDCRLGKPLVAMQALPSPRPDYALTDAAGHDFNDQQPVYRNTANVPFLAFSSQAVKLLAPIWLVMDGIAKGYAVDMAVKALKSQGIQRGWVNAGGDLRIFGDIEARFDVRFEGQSVCAVQLRDSAMATSAMETRSDYAAILLTQSAQRMTGCYSVAAPWGFVADALTKAIAACPEQQVAALLAPFNAQLIYRHTIL